MVPEDDRRLTSSEAELKPTAEEVFSVAHADWLTEQSTALGTADPSEDFTEESKAAIARLISGASLIALGESTHGSSEIFSMKHRLVRLLVEEHGFRVFAIEGSMAAAEEVNRYVLEGKGDRDKAIVGMGFWTWSTEEVALMVEWMREYNIGHPDQKVQFRGFDCQFTDHPLKEIRKILSGSDQSTDTTISHILDLLSGIETAVNADPLRQEIPDLEAGINRDDLHSELQCRLNDSLILVSELKDAIGRLAADPYWESQSEWIQQLGDLLHQAVTCGFLDIPTLKRDYAGYRDARMADNLEWLQRNATDSKVIIWAHNFHIMQEPIGSYVPMGAVLAQHHEDSYRAIGFCFSRGEFTAYDRKVGGLRTSEALPAPIGSIEWYLGHDVPLKAPFLTDFRLESADPRRLSLAELALTHRYAGAIPEDPGPGAFVTLNPFHAFTGMIYMPTSSATRILESYSHRPKYA